MQNEATHSAQTMFPGLMPREIAELGQERLNSLVETQKQFLGRLDEMNKTWLTRTEAMAKHVSELAEKLASSRSVSDTSAAYQQWVSRRLDVFLDDSRRFFGESQKFMDATARLLNPNGEQSANGSANSNDMPASEAEAGDPEPQRQRREKRS